VTFTTGWQSVGGTPFNSANKIKLIVTRHSFDFWVNGFRILRIMRAFNNDYLDGKISIGAGAGEVGGIAFEFDNIEIRGLMPLNKRLHDYLILKELEENEKTPSQNGLCLNCKLPLLGLAFSPK